MVIVTRLIFLILGLIPLAWSTRVNANYFTTKSFLLYAVSGVCFLIWVMTKKRRTLEIPAGIWTWLIGFFICFQLLITLVWDLPESVFYLPKFLSLLGLFMFFSFSSEDGSHFFKKFEWLGLVFFSVLIGLTLGDFEAQFNVRSFQNIELIRPFGNVNMLAEFYILCLPLVYFWVHKKNKIDAHWKVIVFGLINVIVLLSKSRSAYLGLGLWWFVWAYEFYFKRHGKQLVILILAVGVTGFFVNQAFMATAQKTNSSSERSNFYRSTWDLIQDYPLGVGTQYATKVVPYRLNYPSGPNELEYPDQPHSEILKWGVEFGWVGLAIALWTLGLIGHFIWMRGSFLLKGALAVVLPQLLFQFPFENPASIIFMALYLYFLSRELPHKKLTWDIKWRGFSALAGLFLIYYAGVFIVSIYNESNYEDKLENTYLACQINPIYLRGCVRKDYNLMQSQKYAELRINLKQDMRFNYYTPDYLKILNDLVQEKNIEPDLVMQNDSATSISVYDSPENQSKVFKKTCQIIHVYTFIYRDQRHFPNEDIVACKDVPPPFPLEMGWGFSPKKFENDYKNWLETILTKG